jgi:hypothetical protein
VYRKLNRGKASEPHWFRADNIESACHAHQPSSKPVTAAGMGSALGPSRWGCRNYPRRRANGMASTIRCHPPRSYSPRPAGPISEPLTKRSVSTTTTQVSPRLGPGHPAASNHQALSLMAMTWAGGAFEQPTITGRTRRGRTAYSPLSVCDDCTFSRSIHRDGV